MLPLTLLFSEQVLVCISSAWSMVQMKASLMPHPVDSQGLSASKHQHLIHQLLTLLEPYHNAAFPACMQLRAMLHA